MKHKYKVLVVALFVICISILPTSGAQGIIRVVLPTEMEGKEVFIQGDEEEQTVKVQGDGVAVVENVSPGNYQIRIPSAAGYEFQDSEVRIPSWNEEEKRMSYDVRLEPKYQKVTTSPKTGDNSHMFFYGIGAMTAFMLGVGVVLIKWKK